MVSPNERGMLARLQGLVQPRGRYDQTTEAFRATVQLYLQETMPVLTHPRVAQHLLGEHTQRLLIQPLPLNISAQGRSYEWSITLKKKERNTFGIDLDYSQLTGWHSRSDERVSLQNVIFDKFNQDFPTQSKRRRKVNDDISVSVTVLDSSQAQSLVDIFKAPRVARMQGHRPIHEDDFVRYPQLFAVFRSTVNGLLQGVIDVHEGGIDYMQRHIAGNLLQDTLTASIPGALVNFPAEQGLSQQQIELIIGKALAENQRIQQIEQQGVTKGDLQNLLVALMETTARDTTRTHDSVDQITAYAQLRSLAGNNPRAQQAVEAFITNNVNLRDPQRIIQSVLKIVGGFVPGAQGVVALLEALNEWTKP